MSRNSDRANTVLFRYQEQQAEAHGHIDYNSTQRPRAINKVSTLKDAENWRKQVLQEINQKLAKIQDEKLSNYQIRDLNDELNKLMKEKYSWEYHTSKNLNGPDYFHSSNVILKANGVMIRGYSYFGRARELPGVKELIAKQEQNKKDKVTKAKTTMTQLQKLKELESRVGLHYYGYLDEESQETRQSPESQVNEILGLETHDEPKVDLHDKLLKFERRATKKRSKALGDSTKTDPVLISNEQPATFEQVQKYLLDRRRQQLQEKFNI